VICLPINKDNFKDLFLFCISLTLIITWRFDTASAKDLKENIHVKRFINSSDNYGLWADGRQFVSSSLDTYNIVRYDFENRSWQGWTRVDNTAQPDTFFHADDFVGLGGGDFGCGVGADPILPTNTSADGLAYLAMVMVGSRCSYPIG